MDKRLTRKKLMDLREVILEAYASGSTLRELAEIYNCTPGTVWRRLHEWGAPIRPKGPRKKVK